MLRSAGFFQSPDSPQRKTTLPRVSSQMLSKLLVENHAEIDQDSRRDLGRGAQGSTFLVRVKLPNNDFLWCVLKTMGHESQRKEVAINKQLTANDESTITHNIVKLLGETQLGQNNCALFSRCEMTLDRQISTFHDLKRTDPELFQLLVVKLMLDLLHAIEYMHSQNFVHRDIKPDNIGFHRNHWCLYDFGCATVKDSNNEPVQGTFYFMHPAGFVKGVLSAKYFIDIYGLGQTIKLLLSSNVLDYYKEFFQKNPFRFLILKCQQYSATIAKPAPAEAMGLREKLGDLQTADGTESLKIIVSAMTNIRPETIPEPRCLIECLTELREVLLARLGQQAVAQLENQYSKMIDAQSRTPGQTTSLSDVSEKEQTNLVVKTFFAQPKSPKPNPECVLKRSSGSFG